MNAKKAKETLLIHSDFDTRNEKSFLYLIKDRKCCSQKLFIEIMEIMEVLSDKYYFAENDGEIIKATYSIIFWCRNGTKITRNIPMQELFSIACDPISNFPIWFGEQERCDYCNSCQFESLMIKPTEFINVEVPVVTHENWKCLDNAQRREKIEEELRNRYKRFVNTLNQCGLFLLDATDEEIETCIFENFYIGVRGNMSDDLELFILKDWINNEIKEKCRILISLFLDIKVKQRQIWNTQSVKTSEKWLNIMKLSDEIKAMLMLLK